MPFLERCRSITKEGLGPQLAAVDPNRVHRALDREERTEEDFLSLLSPAAEAFLEPMAERAHQLTLQHFGRTVQLFTPLYLSNHCTNACVYCGFGADTPIPRRQLTTSELRAEAEAIAASGLKHLLILTGEAPRVASVDYLEACVRELQPLFPSIALEIYPLQEQEYARLIAAGVDGLTIYQETYDEELYQVIHPRGPKRDFAFRLGAPERGCQAGMRWVGLGALLGLSEWRREAYLTGLHADFLQRRYPQTEVGVSLPRIRPHAGAYQPQAPVSDRHLVQILLALRLFLPHAGITISTREAASLRDALVPLGVTRMSAGVSTAVGGHSAASPVEGQFEISDERSVEEMTAALHRQGYQPVFKDWEPLSRERQA